MERAMAETGRRREKQNAYNQANGITPESIKKSIGDIMNSAYERDHVLVKTRTEGDAPMIGHNLRAHLDGLKKKMAEKASNLEFEEAARIRDEVKRLEAAELAVSDDPFARQSDVDEAKSAAVSKPFYKRGSAKPTEPETPRAPYVRNIDPDRKPRDDPFAKAARRATTPKYPGRPYRKPR
jgi:excinuclease ABC subunit B